MNRPAFQQILEHSPDKPVLVFVSSRRQTRLTAKELVFLSQSKTPPVSFLHLPETTSFEQFESSVIARVHDTDLKDAIRGGVGMHHAGLHISDRALCERLFTEGVIQILVATSTLAWGVNLPARMVILKVRIDTICIVHNLSLFYQGTEFFDGKLKQYVDMPITDVLQMIGRAGRPQFDTEAVACVFIHEPKKQFYRRFL